MAILSNSREMSQSERNDLEKLIDSSTLADVIEALAVIAREKAEHIRTNWQDRNTAQPWDAMASKLERIGSQSAV